MGTTKRTRKWIYMAQEAQRLAALGLPKRTIADRLGVDRSTVSRWMTAGKLPNVPPSGPRQAGVTDAIDPGSPDAWAASVRATYALDATDNELLTLATHALTLARDPAANTTESLRAMGRFQALVRQLALGPARELTQAPTTPQAPTPPTRPRVVRPGGDPRLTLVG